MSEEEFGKEEEEIELLKEFTCKFCGYTWRKKKDDAECLNCGHEID